MKDTLHALGKLNIKKYDAFGDLVQELDVPNLVVIAGLNYIATKLNSVSNATQISYMGVGTNNTPPNPVDTALPGQLARQALTTLGGTIVTSGTAPITTYTATFAPGVATGAWTEAGLFTAATGAPMLSRTVFSTITKAAADTITVTWSLTIS